MYMMCIVYEAGVSVGGVPARVNDPTTLLLFLARRLPSFAAMHFAQYQSTPICFGIAADLFSTETARCRHGGLLGVAN